MESIFNLWSKMLGLPPLASSNGVGVDWLIILIHWLMIALFVGWFGYFVITLVRFRSSRHPKADYQGVRSHASSYIELVVAGIEVVLLAFVAIPLWARAASKFPSPAESTEVQIVAQQFAWNLRYTGKDGGFGKQSMGFVTPENIFGVDPADAKGKDDVQLLNEMHVPVNKPVIAYISSKDVIHSFKVLAMRMTQDAIPGMRIPVHFTPTKEGRYQINCAQLCGNGHSSMSGGFLVVDSQADYDKWLAAKSTAAAAGGNNSFE